MKKGVSVRIDDCKFNSIKEAAEFLEMSTAKLNHLLRKEPKILVNDLEVERTSPVSFKQRFEILCTNTGEVFKSIPEMLHTYGLKYDTSNPIYQHVMRQLKEKGRVQLGAYNMKLQDAHERAKYIRSGKVIDDNEFAVDEQVKATVVETSTQDEYKSGVEALQSIVIMLINKGEYEAAQKVLGVLVSNKEELLLINCA